MVMLFIFKNILGIGVLFCYEFVCGFSSMPAFEYSYILLYNVVLTVFPPLIIGIFDRDLGPGVLMTFPELYKVGLLQQEFTNSRFLIYSLEGVYQSILCFLIPYFSYRIGTVEQSGRVQDMYEMGLAMAVVSIAQANIFAAVVSQSFSGFHALFIWGSVLLIFVYSAMYALLPRALSQANPNYEFTRNVMATATFWAVILLTIVCCNLPRLIARYVRRTYYPKDLDILQEICQMQNMDPRVLMEGNQEHLMESPSERSQQSNSLLAASSVHDASYPVVSPSSKDKVQGTGNVAAYRALGRYLRLDWIWGPVPVSAPPSTRSIVTYPSDDNVTVDSRPSVLASQSNNENVASTEIPSRLVVHTTPATLSPSLKLCHSTMRSREGGPASSLNSPSSGVSSAGSSLMYRSSSRRFHHPTPAAIEDEISTGSCILDSTANPSMILRRQQHQQVRHRLQGEEIPSFRSASPTFVGLDLRSPTFGPTTTTMMTSSTHIGVSDPLSSKPPTPILGFGFAQVRLKVAL